MDVLRDVWAEVGFYVVGLGLIVVAYYGLGLWAWAVDRRRRGISLAICSTARTCRGERPGFLVGGMKK